MKTEREKKETHTKPKKPHKTKNNPNPNKKNHHRNFALKENPMQLNPLEMIPGMYGKQ